MKKAYLHMLLLSILAEPILAMQSTTEPVIKIDRLEYGIVDEKLRISFLILNSGNPSFFEPPQIGKILVINNSTSGCSPINSFDSLIELHLKNPTKKFGIIQIGPLDADEKLSLRDAIDIKESGKYFNLIQALRQAQGLTLGMRFYDLTYQFEQFVKDFTGALRL